MKYARVLHMLGLHNAAVLFSEMTMNKPKVSLSHGLVLASSVPVPIVIIEKHKNTTK